MSSPTRPDSAKPLCAETSRAHAEPLHATASRVDTWILIEYRGLWAHDAVDGSTLSSELKAFLVEERRRLPHARILFVRRNERRSRDGLLAYVARSTRSERGLRCLELERHDDLIGLDLGCGRRAGRAPALPRLHARQARPLLREVRPAALRRGRGAGRGRLGLAVVAHRRRPLRRQPRRARRRRLLRPRRAGGGLARRRGRARAARAPARSTAAARATASPPRRRRSRCGKRRHCSASTTSACARSPATVSGWRAEVAAAGTAYEVDVHVEEGAPTHLTCSTSRLSRPKRFVAGTPRARAA